MNEVRYNMHYPVTTEARQAQSNLKYGGLGDRNVCWWVWQLFKMYRTWCYPQDSLTV